MSEKLKIRKKKEVIGIITVSLISPTRTNHQIEIKNLSLGQLAMLKCSLELVLMDMNDAIRQELDGSK